MSGLDEILDFIATQQQQTEESILSAAKSKADSIKAEGEKKAVRAYEEHLLKSKQQAEKEFENACSSVDANVKRKILAAKVDIIDETIEKTVSRLKSLPDKDYFELIEKIASAHLRPGKGILSLSEKDMARIPSDFEKRMNDNAQKIGGSIELSKKSSDIDDGFVLNYGLISENCSFRAIIDADKDEIRDTAARILFG
jgi:V/A-type H+-transporting ATPase subunit E